MTLAYPMRQGPRRRGPPDGPTPRGLQGLGRDHEARGPRGISRSFAASEQPNERRTAGLRNRLRPDFRTPRLVQVTVRSVASVPERGSLVRKRRDGASGRAGAPVHLVTSDAALLARIGTLVDPHLRGYVNQFYALLAQRPDHARLMAWLTEGEIEHLRAAQADHLRVVLDPTVSVTQLVERARRVGRVHAMVGVGMDWYAAAVSDHLGALHELVAPHQDGFDVVRGMAVLSQRFMADLNGALQGYRDIDVAQTDVLLKVTEAVAESRTVPDLARRVLEALSRLDGLVAAFIGRPDSEGGFLFEAGAGAGVDELVAWSQRPDSPVVSTSADTPLGRGPAGQAWRSGETVRCDSYLTDPDTRPWRDWGERFGWRASAAVPLAGEDDLPRAMLSLVRRVAGLLLLPEPCCDGRAGEDHRRAGAGRPRAAAQRRRRRLVVRRTCGSPDPASGR